MVLPDDSLVLAIACQTSSDFSALGVFHCPTPDRQEAHSCSTWSNRTPAASSWFMQNLSWHCNSPQFSPTKPVTSFEDQGTSQLKRSNFFPGQHWIVGKKWPPLDWTSPRLALVLFAVNL